MVFTLCSNSLVLFSAFVSLTSCSQLFSIGIIMPHIVRAYVSILPAFTQPMEVKYCFIQHQKNPAQPCWFAPAEYTVMLTLMSVWMLPSALSHPASSCFIFPGFMCRHLCICHSLVFTVRFSRLWKSFHARLIGTILALLSLIGDTSWAEKR